MRTGTATPAASANNGAPTASASAAASIPIKELPGQFEAISSTTHAANPLGFAAHFDDACCDAMRSNVDTTSPDERGFERSFEALPAGALGIESEDFGD